MLSYLLSVVKKSNAIILAVSLITLATASDLYAGEKWYTSATLNAAAGSYSDAALRDNMFSGGVWLNADYIDDYSFALAYSTYRVNVKDITGGAGTGSGLSTIENVTQDSLAGRYQYHAYSDALAGKLTAQIVAYAITNNASVGTAVDSFTGKATIISPRLAYINYKNNLYMDMEYVWSNYGDNADLTINQLAPSIGFGFNENRIGNRDWLFLKVYLIQSSDAKRSLGEDALTAVNLTWQHQFGPGSLTDIRRFSIDALGGKRVYAVENERFMVYNLEAVQTGSVVFGMGWSPGQDFDVDFIAGSERYENKLIGNTYKREYLYLSLTRHW